MCHLGVIISAHWMLLKYKPYKLTTQGNLGLWEDHQVLNEGSMFRCYIIIAYLLINIIRCFLLLDKDSELCASFYKVGFKSDVQYSSSKQVKSD